DRLRRRLRHRDAPLSGPSPARRLMARVLWLTPFLPALDRSAGAGRMFELIRRLAAHPEIDVLSFGEGAQDAADAPGVLDGGGRRVELVPRHPDRRPDWLGLR